MVKGRSILATIGSLALVLVISFPVFAAEGDAPTSENEGGEPAVVTEPEAPTIEEPVAPSEDPVVEEPVVDPVVTEEPVVEQPVEELTPIEPEDDSDVPVAPSVSSPKSSNKSSEPSKSNNTRISSITFAGIVASYGDGVYTVRDKEVDIKDKSAIKVLTDNKDAKVEISEPAIAGTTATYLIQVTAVDGTKREYKLRVTKTEATAVAASSNSSATTGETTSSNGSGKGLKILIVSIFVLALSGGGVLFYLKFLKGESEDLPDLSHTGGKFKKAFAWNVAQKEDNTTMSDELSDADFESFRKELGND